MSETNREREKQLNMPIGTATHRLRKKIMFSLLQKLAEDTCFKCGSKIEREEDLSIEHKIPWLHNSIDLFWSLDNIAFSHTFCNKTDRPYKGPSKSRKIGPLGTEWCTGHRQFMPRIKFGINTTHWNGVHQYCKECRPQTK